MAFRLDHSLQLYLLSANLRQARCRQDRLDRLLVLAHRHHLYRLLAQQVLVFLVLQQGLVRLCRLFRQLGLEGLRLLFRL